MEKFYVSTSAVYTNAPPHIGFAHESIVADVLARYYRLIGKEVFFLTGTDEHGLKNYRAAKKAKNEPKEFCDHIVELVKDLKTKLSLSYDYFSRTTDQRHIKASQKLWLAVQKAGDLEKRKYAGWYCAGCEAFKTKKEVVNKKCPTHPTTPVEWIEDENYFFKLSKYTSFLKKYLKEHQNFILPKSRYNEILNLLEGGLEDISVSRSKKLLPWGIPVPNDPEQVMYCWFDALTFYISSIGYGDDLETFRKWWGNESFKLHIVGKDINRFHGCLWTSMLHSAGLPLPTQIFVHGFITSGGERISKSKGNIIDPGAIVKKYGTDPFRYFLLAEGFYGDDIDFTEEKLKTRYNADLANGLGNTVSRVARLAENSGLKFDKTKLPEKIYRDAQEDAFRDFCFDLVLQNIWATDLRPIDIHIDHYAPWLEKDKNKLRRILQQEINDLREVAAKLKPFLPETAKRIQKQFAGPKIKFEKPLFPRIK
jgi:methionyl-tRNA synthetase